MRLLRSPVTEFYQTSVMGRKIKTRCYLNKKTSFRSSFLPNILPMLKFEYIPGYILT